MATDDLHQTLTALTEDLVTGQWTPHPTECELASYVAVGLQTAAAGAQPEDSEHAATRALPEIIRSALREIGPDVATPTVTDGRWAAIVVRHAALIEPARVADSEEGHRLAVQLLKACVEVASTLQETPCTICYRLALGWHAVPGHGATSVSSRASAAALFGLHVQTAHPQTPAPNPDYECPDCLHFVSYVERSGDDVEAEGACEVSGPTMLEQHLYSHLLHHVPVPRPKAAQL